MGNIQGLHNSFVNILLNDDGEWDIPMLKIYFSEDMVQRILAIQIDSEAEDDFPELIGAISGKSITSLAFDVSCNNNQHGKTVPSASIIAAQILTQFSQPQLFPIEKNWDTNQLNRLLNAWYPPPKDWIKLNVDASLLQSNMASIAGVLRDDKGRFLFTYGKQRIG
ncbi:hypothetical protein M5K25_021133 [Dendrobium thyrsiflorum]|uniref:RNase H type-1 domain-containing protein n=1 Tax=Dendrobium thyrsiflorum TaxID=117978 RepID=A0ABD0UJ04_DENTH